MVWKFMSQVMEPILDNNNERDRIAVKVIIGIINNYIYYYKLEEISLLDYSKINIKIVYFKREEELEEIYLYIEKKLAKVVLLYT